MKKFRILIMATILTASAALSFGEQPPAPHDSKKNAVSSGAAQESSPVSEKKNEEVRKKLDTVKIWRLTEQLKLDPETSIKVSSLLSSIDQQRKAVQREQMDSMKALRQSINAEKPDQNAIKMHLEKLDKSRHALNSLKDKEISGLKPLLSLEQQARYTLFNQEFRREMRSMIEDARGGGRSKATRDSSGPSKRERKKKNPAAAAE